MTELINSMLPFYDFEIENSSQFIDKNEVQYDVAFAHLEHLIPSKSNAFLFNKRLD